jgi:hypothetical protein
MSPTVDAVQHLPRTSGSAPGQTVRGALKTQYLGTAHRTRNGDPTRLAGGPGDEDDSLGGDQTAKLRLVVETAEEVWG